MTKFVITYNFLKFIIFSATLRAQSTEFVSNRAAVSQFRNAPRPTLRRSKFYKIIRDDYLFINHYSFRSELTPAQRWQMTQFIKFSSNSICLKNQPKSVELKLKKHDKCKNTTP